MPTDELHLPKLNLLKSLQEDLMRIGISTEIVNGSLCVYKRQVDKSTGLSLAMTSAIASFTHNQTMYQIYCIEQYDENNQIRKYSIKLNNRDLTLKAWELDTKRGSHVHEFWNGIKRKLHLPFNGNIEAISQDLIQIIERNGID